MEVLFERVAGLDVGKASVTVCVRVPGRRHGSRSSVTRSFRTTIGSLRVMRDWLVECGVALSNEVCRRSDVLGEREGTCAMGWIDRLRGRAENRGSEQRERRGVCPVRMLGGDEDLEVVGESRYQEALWSLSGAQVGQSVRCAVAAVLVPEPQNAYDPNAVAVAIEGHRVGYLDRSTAAAYVSGLNELMRLHEAHIGLWGVIVGGGYYEDGPGRLGVWLEHEPSEFGVAKPMTGPHGRPVFGSATMRTGFSEAWLTDAEDDSYDLSWYDGLPDGDRSAIAMLQNLLATDPDPIDRHFQFAELESRLYRCRDLYDSALDEFDDACKRHDAEMETICAAFMAKWGKVPLLETYRQMAIRQQKKKDWTACLWWAERGIALYGDAAAREDAVEDLLKRRARAKQKLAAPVSPRVKVAVLPSADVIASVEPTGPPPGGADIEVLVCGRCESRFERLRVRGRKPQLCPTCRSTES
ncbi:MAG TPA: HIRAN domain-containing protein [Kribbella sp.]